MPKEDGALTPEVEAGISQATDEFMKLFEMKLPGAARSWAESIARFSERPIRVEPTDLMDGGKVVRLSLTACGRDLFLDFHGAEAVRVQYNDGNMRQTSEINNVPWAGISSVSPSHLLILLENGEFVGIKKESGTVVVKSLPFDQIPIEDNF